jgi:microsomal dipeptidase-like Zn-dependent dipeptidase
LERVCLGSDFLQDMIKKRSLERKSELASVVKQNSEGKRKNIEV